ncbi:GDP-mannose 4,6-dehydratase [Paenibacillus larvae]|nr:NAD-dependent epimerase/dehydratase family protein [Paenibacillus larvae]MDT2255835.1 GDP-mannose 4,6-dehydratase [Paenibacillus larvae]
MKLLKTCAESGVQKFVFASTSGVYGELQKERVTETDPVQPISFTGCPSVRQNPTSGCFICCLDYPLQFCDLAMSMVRGKLQKGKAV